MHKKSDVGDRYLIMSSCHFFLALFHLVPRSTTSINTFVPSNEPTSEQKKKIGKKRKRKKHRIIE